MLFGDSIWQFFTRCHATKFYASILSDIGKLVPPFYMSYDLSWCMHNLRYNLGLFKCFPWSL